MRYLGQGYDVSVPFAQGENHAATIAAIREGFEASYLKLYGRIYPNLQLELMTFRLSASARRNVGRTSEERPRGESESPVQTRRAFCPKQRTWQQFSVYKRSDIATGLELNGPAIVEENESTTVVPSGAVFHVDEHGSLIITLAK
jgi:N-methylhydantoinase A